MSDTVINSTSPNTNINNSSKKKSGLSLWFKIKLFFILIIFLGFLTAGGLIFAMVNPTSGFAQFAQKYLGFNYVISNKNDLAINNQTNTNQATSSSSSSSSSSSGSSTGNKLLNNLFGLDVDRQNQTPSKFADSQINTSPTEQVVEQVLPSVVSISAQVNKNTTQGGLVEGTGFFVSEEGLIITNKHVVAQLCTIKSNQAQILATDSKDKAWEVNLVSVDPTTDLAILKIKDPDGQKFSKVSFLPSENIKLGMEVIAIGNALGQLKNTVTSGVISGIGRDVVGAEDDECGGYSAFSEGLIQTDAAINKGNSGGPLFNKAGILVGVNTFKSENGQSIGLAIPADEVSKTLNSYLKNGKITKPYLGVLTKNITDTYKKQNPWIPKDYGAMIAFEAGSVYADSAASKAGLQPGDIILSIDSQDIKATETNDSPLRRIISKYESGTKVKLSVLKSKLSLIKGVDGQVAQKVEYETDPIEVEVMLGSLESPL